MATSFLSSEFIPSMNMSWIESPQDEPLHEAVRLNDETTVLHLLQNGANPNQTNDMNYTPVHEAVKYGREELLKHLVKFGGDINRIGGDGYLPLQMVPLSKHPNFMNAVLDCKPDLNKKDVFGTPTLIYYVREHPSRLQDILKLLEYGSDPNLTDRSGCNSLHHLANNWSISKSALARALISYGIDVDAVTPDSNLSALQFAYNRNNNSRLMHILLVNGATLRTDWGKMKPFDWKAAYNVAVIFTHGIMRGLDYSVIKKVVNLRSFSGDELPLYNKCERQLKKMKVKRIRGQPLTYYEFLMLSKEDCSKLIVDDDLRKEITKTVVIFPQFSDFFLDKLYAGVQWRQDNKKAADFLSSLFILPLEVSEHILSFFSNDDLAYLHRRLRIL
ncbi:poly [ADP-ribose] polymerase tankyrase-2-like [Harmonia axyridis]|uniref:poly [ADP-ribose] polymerase tankyrase-2-like n=1 Tax=Harmonia axyridis TaxID=115357 RepID=UPI001E276862|nr:poly [ADP-ribose] polymerase tankyrase-2-like [Harmonia axyridis]